MNSKIGRKIINFLGLKFKLKSKKYKPIDLRGNIPYEFCRFENFGDNNKIIVVENGIETKITTKNYLKYFNSLELSIRGNNNTIKIHLPAKWKETKIIANGDGNYLEFKPTKYKYDKAVIRALNGSKIVIDEDFSCASNLDICIGGKDTKLEIGKDCMFSDGIKIFNNDGHQILDMNDNLLNPPPNIFIGNHVWCGMKVTIFNQTHIQDNTIIGACSVVTKKFDKYNIIIAGVPAKIIKENVKWIRDAV